MSEISEKNDVKLSASKQSQLNLLRAKTNALRAERNSLNKQNRVFQTCNKKLSDSNFLTKY